MGVIFVYAVLLTSCAGGLFRPRYGVYGYITFVSLCPQWLWRYSLPDPDFAFQKYIAGSTLLGYLLSGLKGQKLVGCTKIAALCGLAFLGLSCLSSLTTIAAEPTSIFINAIWKTLLMLYLSVRIIDTPQKALKVLWIVILCVGWNAFELNADYYQRGYSFVNMPGSEGWARMNANAYALVLLLITVLSAAVAATSKYLAQSLGAIVISLLCVNAIYILESRGAMIGLLFSGLVFIYLVPKTRKVVCRISIVLGVAATLAGPSVAKEFMSSFESDNRDTSAESRFYIWDAGIRICADYPLLGVGPWAGEWLMPSYYKFEKDELKLPTKALHNLTLEVATGSGVPALLAYLGLFFLPLMTLRRSVRQNSNAHLQTIALGCLAGIPGYWLASQFNSGALVEVPYIVVGLALAVANQSAIAQSCFTRTI